MRVFTFNYDGKLVSAMAEVHASNMSKLGADGKPVVREDGKILKGPNYFKPDLEGVIGFLDNEDFLGQFNGREADGSVSNLE